jgi:hypothetical protein
MVERVRFRQAGLTQALHAGGSGHRPGVKRPAGSRLSEMR